MRAVLFAADDVVQFQRRFRRAQQIRCHADERFSAALALFAQRIRQGGAEGQLGHILLELPAGKLEPGEIPLEAAKREQKEETGTQAEEYLSLGKYFATPAYCTEQIYLWACRVTAFGEQHLDEGEFLEVVTVPLEKAVAMVLNNEIPDGKTQVGILKTYVLVKGGKL